MSSLALSIFAFQVDSSWLQFIRHLLERHKAISSDTKMARNSHGISCQRKEPNKSSNVASSMSPQFNVIWTTSLPNSSQSSAHQVEGTADEHRGNFY
jgi:hypothetical protein